MLKKKPMDLLGCTVMLMLLAFPFFQMMLADLDNGYYFRCYLWAGYLSLVLAVPVLLNRRRLWERKQVRWLLIAAGLFFLPTILGQLFGYQNILYYISGLWNNLRFFIFFFACILWARAEDREKWMKLLDAIFAVNFLVTLYQYFVLGINWDYLGGIFGTEPGCNAYTNVLFLIVVSYSVLGYMNQREKAWVCLVKCAMALIVTAMAELKIFIVEFVGIIAWALLFTKFTRRKLYLLIGGIIGLLAGVKLMLYIFPGWAYWFNIKTIIEVSASEGGYVNAGDMNRLTTIPIALESFLLTIPQKLFGLGLGNCDYGPIGAMSSPFYNDYAYLHYSWFMSGQIVLETGLVGVVTYLGFFFTIFLGAFHLRWKENGDVVFCQLTELLAAMCFVLFLYNNCLRLETAYLLLFIMALAFARKEK